MFCVYLNLASLITFASKARKNSVINNTVETETLTNMNAFKSSVTDWAKITQKLIKPRNNMQVFS